MQTYNYKEDFFMPKRSRKVATFFFTAALVLSIIYFIVIHFMSDMADDYEDLEDDDDFDLW